MAANHLIIGLGGTGGKIIRSLRKAVFQAFRKEDADGVNIGYLYVDSSAEMMSIDDPSWKILGTSVQLNKRSQLLIQEANLTARLENIDNYPGIKPWIGDPEQWKDVLGSIIGVTLGGQKRRLGRFLFACKADGYRQQVQSLVKDLQSGGTTETTFHIVCGLAGGTGSGTIVDAISIVRDTYPDSKRYRILVYALLPETYPNPSWDTGNYHANGYAALLELNSLSVGRLCPDDLLGVKGKLKLSDAFNGMYVFTNENENGLTVDVDKQLPGIVADFLYQKIVVARTVSWPTLGRMENAENGDGTPERAPATNNPERSKRMLAFGIKRLAIPEQEIGEYLTYNFALEAALQLRYNNWSDTAGFLDESRNQDFHEFVNQKETQFRWALSDDHLTLSTGILPEDAANKKWKPINNEWQDVIPNFKSLVREKSRESWLDELSKLCEKRFDQDYRGVGVRAFYQSKLKAKKEHVREIRRRIEDDLFTDWKNGVKSANDISRLLAALLESIDDRRRLLDDKITAVKDNEESAGNRVRVNNQQWAHMGLLSKVVGKPDSLLDAQGEALQEQYIYRTRIEALQFAKQFSEELVTELTDLKSEVDKAASMIAAAVKKYTERIAERIQDDGKRDLREQLVRFYDPQVVRAVSSTLAKNETEQRTQSNRVRQALAARLGDHPSFSLFNQRLGVADFVDVLDKECAASAQVAHNNIVTNPKEKLLGVSIIDRLRERYGGDAQELRSYVTELVARAGNYLSFDASEMHKTGPGIPSGAQTAVSRLSILMPKAPEQAEFTAKLKETFQGAREGDVEIIDSDVNANEITLISLTNLFPLRYAKQVAFLKQRYDQKVNGPNAARAKLELHIEGDGTQHPRLFVPLQEEVRRDAIPYLLLAKVTGLLRDESNPQTGEKTLTFVAKDDTGFDTDPIDLGKTMADTPGKVTLEYADIIRGYVTKKLESSDYAPDPARADLQKSIVAEVERIKVERGNNVNDDVYHRFLDGGKQAVKILKREN
jgi:hypothetical protein